jgi:hypothetical protein
MIRYRWQASCWVGRKWLFSYYYGLHFEDDSVALMFLRSKRVILEAAARPLLLQLLVVVVTHTDCWIEFA